jgi:hypothetical protein
LIGLKTKRALRPQEQGKGAIRLLFFVVVLRFYAAPHLINAYLIDKSRRREVRDILAVALKRDSM